MLQPQYQLATLHAPEAGTWLICFYCYHPGTQKLERLRFTFAINRIKCKAERRRVAMLHISNINHALQHGWNYFVDVEGITPTAGMHSGVAIMAAEPVSIVQALHKALRARQLGMKPRTAGTYASYVTKLCEWLKANDLERLPVAHFTDDHFREYLYYKHEQGHVNRSINDAINFFKTTFDVIRKNKLIADNPLKDVDYLAESESTLFAEITASELKLIGPALINRNARFYLYTKFIALNFIRPYHIARLKASQILYDRDMIALDSGTTKNNKAVHKQLNPQLKELLIAMKYNELPGNYYLFGKDFLPSPAVFESLSTRAAELWKDIVIDGLRIDKKMYALKHTAGTYLVNENEDINIQWLASQMEHSNFSITEHYIKNRKVKKIDQGKVNTIDY